MRFFLCLAALFCLTLCADAGHCGHQKHQRSHRAFPHRVPAFSHSCSCPDCKASGSKCPGGNCPAPQTGSNWLTPPNNYGKPASMPMPKGGVRGAAKDTIK